MSAPTSSNGPDSTAIDPVRPPSEIVLDDLLSLPDVEIVEKIQAMNVVQTIEFSLISGKCKNLVKSAEIQGTRIKVDIKSKVVVCFDLETRERCTLKFWNIDRTSNFDKKLKAPLGVKIITGGFNARKKVIRKNEFEMEDWMEHFYTIFNNQGTYSLMFGLMSSEYDPVDLKKYFGVPCRLEIESTGCYVYNQAILQTFLPVDSLTIEPTVFENSRIPPEILIQNFTTLIIDEFVSNNPRAVSLEELLMINSKKIDIRKARMGPKDINKFIKLWQRGANPRMEYLRIYYEIGVEDDENTILNGIKYTKIPKNVYRWLKLAERGEEQKVMSGGMDVYNFDGVKATIHVNGVGLKFLYGLIMILFMNSRLVKLISKVLNR